MATSAEWRPPQSRSPLLALLFCVLVCGGLAAGLPDLAPPLYVVDPGIAARSASALGSPPYQLHPQALLAYYPFDGSLVNVAELLSEAVEVPAGSPGDYNSTIGPVRFPNASRVEALAAGGGTPHGVYFGVGVAGLAAFFDGSGSVDTGLAADAAAAPVVTLGAWVLPDGQSQRVGAMANWSERYARARLHAVAPVPHRHLGSHIFEFHASALFAGVCLAWARTPAAAMCAWFPTATARGAGACACMPALSLATRPAPPPGCWHPALSHCTPGHS